MLGTITDDDQVVISLEEAQRGDYTLTAAACAELLSVAVRVVRRMLTAPVDEPSHLPSTLVLIGGRAARRVRLADLEQVVEARLSEPLVRAVAAVELLAGRRLKPGTSAYYKYLQRLHSASESGRLRAYTLPGMTQHRYSRTDVKSLALASDGDGKEMPAEVEGEQRFCEFCDKSLGVIPDWMIQTGMGRFCDRSHAQRWLAEHHPEKFRRDELRTGQEGKCPGCGETRYYSPADIPMTGYCKTCLPSSDTGQEIRVRARRPVRARQISVARNEGILPQDGQLLAEAARKIGVSRPYLTSYIIRSGLLAAERRTLAGIEVWVVRNPELQRFRRKRSGDVNRLGRRNPWRDPNWVQGVALDRGWDAALAAKLGITRSAAVAQIRRAVELRRQRPAGRGRKDMLRDQLRAIVHELEEKYVSLSAFAENEILAEIGELAWTHGLDDFRQKYPPDRFGDFDFQYRGNVISRVRGLIVDDVKALLSPGKQS